MTLNTQGILEKKKFESSISKRLMENNFNLHQRFKLNPLTNAKGFWAQLDNHINVGHKVSQTFNWRTYCHYSSHIDTIVCCIKMSVCIIQGFHSPSNICLDEKKNLLRKRE